MQTNFGFGTSGIVQRRKNYSLLDIFADLGGVFDILKYLLGILLLPVARHSFIIKVLKKTFNIEQHIYDRRKHKSDDSGSAD